MKSSWFFLVVAFIFSEYILLVLIKKKKNKNSKFFKLFLGWAATTSAPGGFSAVALQSCLQVEKPEQPWLLCVHNAVSVSPVLLSATFPFEGAVYVLGIYIL